MILIQVRGGPSIGYTPFTFPDGQRHVTLDGDVSHSEVWVTASLTCADDLFDLLLVKDVLDYNSNETHLFVEYLLGARMDRRIDRRQPYTLRVVASIINGAGFKSVQVLDPHSPAATSLLGATAKYPYRELFRVLEQYDPADTAIVIPDAGATDRVMAMLDDTEFRRFVQCYKRRNLQTGKLIRIDVGRPALTGTRCLIVDDICDGGATFVGIAKELRKHGAVEVSLFVTHGIFSKGHELVDIDNVYSTESFKGRVHDNRGVRTGYGQSNCSQRGSQF